MKTKAVDAPLVNRRMRWLVGRTLAFFGDSITAEPRGSYVGLVAARLAEQCGGPVFNIVNSGVDSSSIYDITDRLPEVLLEYDPDIVIVFVGINDSKILKCTKRPLVSVRDFREAYARFVNGADSGRKRIKIVVTLPPLMFSSIVSGAALAEYWYWNEADYNKYCDVIRGFGSHGQCVVADVQEAFRKCTESNERLFSGDGVHPSIVGHRVIAEVITKAIGRCRGQACAK